MIPMTQTTKRRLAILGMLTIAALVIQTATVLACSTPYISRSKVIERVAPANGYSYWWGHGRWGTSVNTSDGSCCGASCPGCSHYRSRTKNSRCSDQSGVVERGADCSGLIATAWMIRPDCRRFSITRGAHPYGTWHFRYRSYH